MVKCMLWWTSISSKDEINPVLSMLWKVPSAAWFFKPDSGMSPFEIKIDMPSKCSRSRQSSWDQSAHYGSILTDEPFLITLTDEPFDLHYNWCAPDGGRIDHTLPGSTKDKAASPCGPPCTRFCHAPLCVCERESNRDCARD